MRHFAALFCLMVALAGGSPQRDELMSVLLKDYVVSIPTVQEGEPLAISVGLGLARAEIDEQEQVLTTNAWLRLMWKDYRLQWDPNENGGISTMHIPSQHLWTPDITMYHYSVEEPKFGKDPTVLVQSDGTVIYAPTVLIKADCTQEAVGIYSCPLTFGSYTYDGRIMVFEHFFGRQTLDAEDYKITKQGWRVVGHEAVIEVKYYPCCPDDPQPVATFHAKFAKTQADTCS